MGAPEGPHPAHECGKLRGAPGSGAAPSPGLDRSREGPAPDLDQWLGGQRSPIRRRACRVGMVGPAQPHAIRAAPACKGEPRLSWWAGCPCNSRAMPRPLASAATARSCFGAPAVAPGPAAIAAVLAPERVRRPPIIHAGTPWCEARPDHPPAYARPTGLPARLPPSYGRPGERPHHTTTRANRRPSYPLMISWPAGDPMARHPG